MTKQIPGKQKVLKENIIILYYLAQQWKIFHGHNNINTND